MTGNVVHDGKASRTAWRVATLRAAHQLLDEPIVLDDPISLAILGQQAEHDLRKDPFQYNDPISRGLRAALVVRSKFAEDELARAVGRGVEQYVVLGAGLDTFAYRNPFPTLRVYEVDHSATQIRKRELLGQSNIAIPQNLTFAAVDFEKSSLRRSLSEAGFQDDAPSCFSWLGVTMYLSEEAIMDTLRYIATMPAGSSVTFDFRVLPALKNPVARAISQVMSQRVAAIGEPWLSAFDPADLRATVLGLGFPEVTIYEPGSLNELYLHRRKDALRTNGRLLCARV